MTRRKHRDVAIVKAKDILDQFLKLAELDPERYTPWTAMALESLGVKLRERKHYQESVQASQKAMIIYRKLADNNPTSFNPWLKKSLKSLAGSYDDLGLCDEAEKALAEANNI